MNDQPTATFTQGVEHSATLGELGKALPKAQAGFTHPTKDRTVDVGQYSYSYAQLPACLDAVRPALAANGISLLQPVEVRGTHVRVWTMLLHASGEWIRTALVLTADSPKAQAIGSAITYGRRYGLSAMLGIAADEDEDGALASSAPPPKPVTGQVTPKPKPAPVPVTRGESATAEVFTVTDITTKDGTKDGKAWRKFTVTFDDDRKASTFDSKLGDLAAVCHADGLPVKRLLREAKDPKWLPDLLSLEVVTPDEAVPETDEDDLPF